MPKTRRRGRDHPAEAPDRWSHPRATTPQGRTRASLEELQGNRAVLAATRWIRKALPSSLTQLIRRCSIAPNTDRRSRAIPPAMTVPLSPLKRRGFTLPPVAFQRCGGTAASRTTDGGVAALVSFLTRGPATGAPFLTKSV